MTMALEVNGVSYVNFVAASCSIRLDALSNSFSFEAAMPEGEPLPFKGGEACAVYVNDELKLTGNIEVIDVNYQSGRHTVIVAGRDKTGDLLDSTLDAIPDIRAPISLKQLVEKVVNHLGLDIKVIDQVQPELFNEAEDIASPEPGENAFVFIEKYSRKRQTLLTSDPDGNIVIASNSGDTAVGAVQHIIGASDNNVISSSFSFDTTGRFNLYKTVSQLNPVALNLAGETDLASVVNQGGGVSDSNIRAGRQMVLVSETPFSSSESEARSKWEADIRRSRGLAYSASVTGYTVDASDPDSDLWDINKIYQIVDDFLGKQEPMLCNLVTFTLDLDSGEQTALGFVDEKTYTLDLTKPVTSTTAAGIFG